MTLFDQFDGLFDMTPSRFLAGGASGRAFVPATDLLVSDDEVLVVMDVPGLKADNLEIELTGDVLAVRGERSYPYATDHSSGDWYRLERGYGRFQRLVTVPKGLDPDNITASMVDGVLSIHIPQPEARKPRRIEITSGASAPLEEGMGAGRARGRNVMRRQFHELGVDIGSGPPT